MVFFPHVVMVGFVLGFVDGGSVWLVVVGRRRRLVVGGAAVVRAISVVSSSATAVLILAGRPLTAVVFPSAAAKATEFEAHSWGADLLGGDCAALG
jgi:hypothetical protein